MGCRLHCCARILCRHYSTADERCSISELTLLGNFNWQFVNKIKMLIVRYQKKMHFNMETLFLAEQFFIIQRLSKYNYCQARP